MSPIEQTIFPSSVIDMLCNTSHPVPSFPSTMTTTTTMRVHHNSILPSSPDHAPPRQHTIQSFTPFSSFSTWFRDRQLTLPQPTPPHPRHHHHSRSLHSELYKPFSLPLFDPSPLSVVGLYYHQLPSHAKCISNVDSPQLPLPGPGTLLL